MSFAAGMSPTVRVAAYGVCIEDGRVLLCFHVPRGGGAGTWTLPDGGQNVGVYQQLRGTSGELRAERGGEIVESTWTPLADAAWLCRWSLLDVGLALAARRPASGHVDPAPVGGPIQH